MVNPTVNIHEAGKQRISFRDQMVPLAWRVCRRTNLSIWGKWNSKWSQKFRQRRKHSKWYSVLLRDESLIAQHQQPAQQLWSRSSQGMLINLQALNRMQISALSLSKRCTCHTVGCHVHYCQSAILVAPSTNKQCTPRFHWRFNRSSWLLLHTRSPFRDHVMRIKGRLLFSSPLFSVSLSRTWV